MIETIFKKGLFDGEVAVITGGGTGIGQATALELGGLGARIAICGRRDGPLQKTAQELRAMGIEVLAQTCDIREPQQVDSLLEAVLDRFSSIDVLVNNAGGQFPSPAAGISPKGFESVVRNNLLGTWNVIHAAANMALIPARRGRIVNLVAQTARGFPGMVHTGSARAGVENLTKTLAVEWAMHGIRVNAVAPGVVRTPGTAQYPEELLETARQACPLKRLGHPSEIAHLAVYLVSRQADFITGQTFYIDGGQSLWGDLWQIDDNVPQYPPYS